MEGILTYVDPQGRYGKVDTRNDTYKTLYVKFPSFPDQSLVNSSIFFNLTHNEKGIPYAEFVSAALRNNTVFNTEDRSKWYNFGEDYEREFLEKIEPYLDRDIILNPEKETCPWALDLFDWTKQKYADLKTQTTPFFLVGKYEYKDHVCDPQYSITFNKKDYLNYKEKAKDCDIYFWINWKQLTYQDLSVKPLYGVWRAEFSKMMECIENGLSPLHEYKHRTNDDHNAKDSYIFDLRDNYVMEKVY